jgi:signal transduction histidine kinase
VTTLPRGPLRRLSVSSLLTVALLVPHPAAARVAPKQEQFEGVAQQHKRVLVLYSTRRDSEFSTVGERDLPRLLDVGLERELDYYSEFIDAARFPDPAYQVAFARFLRQKYLGVRVDLVIALHDVAIDFVARNRGDLFPQAPVVFLSQNAAVKASPNSTGLIHRRNFTATLDVIEQLHPDVRNVFVVSGAAATDKGFEQAMRSQVQASGSRLAFTYLSGLPTDALVRRLGALPPRSVVYHLLVTEDGAGNKYHPLDYIERVAAAANAPTYSWVESAMNRGIVGGSLYSQAEAVSRVGHLALRVLHGEAADDIETASIDLNSIQIDWRQLRRWGIEERRIPAGATLRFREPTLWDRYRGYIIGALVLLMAQTALIAGLLVQRVRRHRAEVELWRSQRHLRASYERIRHLGSRLLTAQEGERSRIARELHDDVNQQLAVLTMDLELLSVASASDVQRLAGEALARTQQIAQSVHDLSHSLHPAKLRLIGLIPALQTLRNELQASGMPITFTHDRVPASLSGDVTLCLFRVVQEALQNAIKYSKATEITVTLASTPGGLTLSVVDDGVGFDVDDVWGQGLGLVSMKERLESIGGSLEIFSRPGAGTRVEATAPVDAAIARRDGAAATHSTAVHFT